MPDLKDPDLFKKVNLEALETWVSMGGVKTVILFNANDHKVCENCKQLNNTKFPITTVNEISNVKSILWNNGCTNKQCRCVLKPSDISME